MGVVCRAVAGRIIDGGGCHLSNQTADQDGGVNADMQRENSYSKLNLQLLSLKK